MKISPLAGKRPPLSLLVDLPKLITAYYTEEPDPIERDQKVSFGTSGHRGSSLTKSFNENHLLAIAQAICLYRAEKSITGPLFLGIDTHALSQPALITVLEVLAANNVDVMLAKNNEYTPTPVISHAILTYNQGRQHGLADGIVITPSHNPPDQGGIKYNPPNGGPAEQAITHWIEMRANKFLKDSLLGVRRMTFEKALKAPTTHHHDYMTPYINDLENVVDMKRIRSSGIKLGVDPLGGAGVHYWKKIAEHYKFNLAVINETVDPAFSNMTVDWDGQIRMDPSSPYAMQGLIAMKDRFDVSFACDTDHDRHGIVTKSAGLLSSNDYLSVAISYLFQNRPKWNVKTMIGKTVVSTGMINKIGANLKREVYEVPAGFKWFADGLFNGSLGFGGEESAGASFARLNGSVWTTDKDGIIMALLSAEITAAMGKDLAEIYQDLTLQFGTPFFERVEAFATLEQKEKLKLLSKDEVKSSTLAGNPITQVITNAPGNGASIGGIKVTTEHGWFAARPSGTENIYKIYGESFLSKEHLRKILSEAQEIVNHSLEAKA